MRIILALALAASLAGCNFDHLDKDKLSEAKDIACQAVIQQVVLPKLPWAISVLEAAGGSDILCQLIQVAGDSNVYRVVTMEEVRAVE